MPVSLSRIMYIQEEEDVMKSVFKTMIVVSAFCAGSVYAVDPQLSETSCEQLGETLELTAEAEERLADLIGTCEGVYEIDGNLYTRTSAEVRSTRGSDVTLYLPATDHTFNVTPNADGKVWIGGNKLNVNAVRKGDSLGIYLSVDKFTQNKVDEIHFATPDESEEEVVAATVEPVAALPTTAGSLPLLALVSLLLLGSGLLVRRNS